MDYRTGDDITVEQANRGVFYWELSNPSYFRIKDHLDRPCGENWDRITVEIRFNYNLRRALQIHKCWLTFTIWTTLRPSSSGFLHVFRNRILQYLYDFGVISINAVVRAVKHFVGRFDRYMLSVQQSAHIQFNLY
uniref:Replication enhancer n=1 Tax=Dioscorea alata TaxID=55571 RepID=A0A0G2R279_DIOAL|nr:replication enhancer [Dioscorea alata]